MTPTAAAAGPPAGHDNAAVLDTGRRAVSDALGLLLGFPQALAPILVSRPGDQAEGGQHGKKTQQQQTQAGAPCTGRVHGVRQRI